jgi:PAS domain S-box-containing protein
MDNLILTPVRADYIEKSSVVNKQFIDNERIKYGENSNTCIITCSGNYNTLGTVTNTNNEITRILQYAKGDIIGQNINRIMPKILGDSHDSVMKRYFETSEPHVIGVERLMFPTNKSGYMVPCTLMIKVLPTLDEGIRVVGFLKDVENGGSLAKDLDLDHEENVIPLSNLKLNVGILYYVQWRNEGGIWNHF